MLTNYGLIFGEFDGISNMSKWEFVEYHLCGCLKERKAGTSKSVEIYAKKNHIPVGTMNDWIWKYKDRFHISFDNVPGFFTRTNKDVKSHHIKTFLEQTKVDPNVTVKSYCEENGVNQTTLSSWVRKAGYLQVQPKSENSAQPLRPKSTRRKPSKEFDDYIGEENFALDIFKAPIKKYKNNSYQKGDPGRFGKAETGVAEVPAEMQIQEPGVES